MPIVLLSADSVAECTLNHPIRLSHFLRFLAEFLAQFLAESSQISAGVSNRVPNKISNKSLFADY